MVIIEAGIYARISSDEEGRGLGVARQVADCEAEADRRGWTVVERYVDNDVSATRSKVRPQYEQMLKDIRGQRITGLIVWDVDRLTRTPRELEDVIDLADRYALNLANIGGEIDLATPQGRMTARIKGSVARMETEQMSRRIRRKFDERAEAGLPHSFAAYGYRRVIEYDERGHRTGSRDELDPEQAAIVREMARRVLAGESIRSVVADLNTRGITTARGGKWSATQVRQILLRERNAGLRRHRGQIIGEGRWPAIYDQDTHDRLMALLNDPNRRTQKGSARKHLLTGLAICGRCGTPMVVNVGRIVTTKTGGTKRQPAAYWCPGCTRVKRKETSVDEVVEMTIVARLSRPDALAALAMGDPAESQRAADEADALEARLNLAADQYAEGAITGEQLKRISGRLRPKLAEARALAARSRPSDGLASVVGPDAAARWADAPLDVKRQIIEMLCTITIMPSGPGKPFDPDLVVIEPKR